MNGPTIILVAADNFEGGGLFVGGGWHNLVPVLVAAADGSHTTKSGLVLPADGNWSALSGLGFTSDPTAEVVPTPVASD